MATARERKATRVFERIAGKDDEHGAGGKYCFIELEAENVDAFEALRAEAEQSPAFRRYDFDGTLGRKISGPPENGVDGVDPDHPVAVVKKAAAAARAKTPAAKKSVEAVAEEAESVPAADPEPAAVEPASTSAEGLSPLEIARQKLLARRGEK